MIRLIAKIGDKWTMDLEWGFMKETESEPEHDSDLSSSTERAPEEDWPYEDSTVAKAHKIVGFIPNKEDESD